MAPHELTRPSSVSRSSDDDWLYDPQIEAQLKEEQSLQEIFLASLEGTSEDIPERRKEFQNELKIIKDKLRKIRDARRAARATPGPKRACKPHRLI